jgi:hypothetical protein
MQGGHGGRLLLQFSIHKGTSNNLLHDLIAALGGAQNPHPDLSGLRFLRSIRLALMSFITLFRDAYKS